MDNTGTQQPVGTDPNPVERPAASKLWMKDSSGFPSVTITFLTISFWITTLAYVASIIHKVGPFEFSAFDVGACGAYFGIIFSAYIARRYTDARWGNPNVAASTSTTVVAGGSPSMPPIPPAPIPPIQPPADPSANQTTVIQG